MKTTQRKTSRGRKAPRAPAVARRVVPAEPDVVRRARPVLIATDGSDAASIAIKIARLMVDRGEWTPELITVAEPLPVAVGDIALPIPPMQEEIALTDSLLATIRRQLRRFGAGSWKLTVLYGRAAPLIVKAARESAAELIVIGLGHHTAIARLFGAETAARVIRQTTLPVLAVHPKSDGMPKVGVVALDFGDSSVRAAHEALRLLAPGGRLHLVHVKWGYNSTSLRDSEWERAYHYGVEHGFDRLRAELVERPDVTITTDFVHGGVVTSILETAKKLGANLVALGSHSQTVIDRLVIGSTPAEVLRESECSVLIAPPAGART
jgi:nucleotide-binding universal stress UspA family protein